MTNAEMIRQMSDDELARLLVFGTFNIIDRVPDCDEGCDQFASGCGIDCPHERRSRSVREWLQQEQSDERTVKKNDRY